MLTAEMFLETVKKFNELRKQKDPLYQRGIQFSWYCIVNPCFLTPLREEYDRNKKLRPEGFPINDFDWLRQTMGRETFIINKAPNTHIEYLSPDMAREKYPEFFEKRDEDFFETLRPVLEDIQNEMDQDFLKNQRPSLDI
jgi:hypothetical protein